MAKLNKILEYQEGPDKVRPSEHYTTIYPDGFVKLRIPETGSDIERYPVISIPSLFKKTVERFPNNTALAYQVDDHWQKITYTEYYANVRTCAKAFLKLGLERYHSVGILGVNSPEWFMSELGAIFAGGMSAGIYSTNSPDACLHCLKVSRANICVVENDVQLQKILKIRDQLPDLRAIVQYSGEPKDSSVYSWKQLMEIGAKESDDNLEAVIKNLAPNECCTLVLTSGTIGDPKAAMISHDNVCWNSLINEHIPFIHGQERLISYLPLSHIAGRMFEVYIAMASGAEVYFAHKDALKDKLVDTLRSVQPTRFIAVPRIYEKIKEKMMEVAKQNGYLKNALATWAKSQALYYNTHKIKGIDSPGWGYTLACNLILNRVKAALGLNRCISYYAAAAPLTLEVRQYFMSLDMPIMDVYGMTESIAHTMSIDNNADLRSVGATIPGAKTKISNPDAEGKGEICMYGRHIFMGYLGDQAKTEAAFDEEGCLYTGDQGMIDSRGFVYITGRLKELLITAGGENIAPLAIETVLKEQLPYVSNVVVVGDQKKFLSVLITLKTEVDKNGVPLNTLTKDCQEWLTNLGCPAVTTQEVLSAGPHPNLIKAIQSAIESTNKDAVSNAAKVQKFIILENDFSLATGEFGPTLKLKRNFVTSKYSNEINSMYL